MNTIVILISGTGCLIGVMSFALSRLEAVKDRAKIEQAAKDKFEAIEKQRLNDMELISLKMTAISERLYEHIGANTKEHDELKRVSASIEEKFREIMATLARLEERSCRE